MKIAKLLLSGLAAVFIIGCGFQLRGLGTHQLPPSLSTLRVVVQGSQAANDPLRLTMARLHLQAGQKPQARELLESLAKLGDKFSEHAEVKSLLASL